MDFTIVVLGLLLTAVSYMLFPLIRLLVNRGRFVKERAHKIALWNSIIVGAIFCIATIAVSETGTIWNGAPAVLYYWINRSILTDASVNSQNISRAVHEDNRSKKKGNKKKIVIVLLVVLLAIALIVGISIFLKKNEPDYYFDSTDPGVAPSVNTTNPNNVISYDVTRVKIAADSGGGVGDVYSQLIEHEDYLILDSRIGQVYDVNYKIIGGVGVTHLESDGNVLKPAYGPIEDWWYNVTLPDGREGFVWGGTDGMYIEEIIDYSNNNTNVDNKDYNVDFTEYTFATFIAEDVDTFCGYMSELKEMMSKGTYGIEARKEKVTEYVNELPIEYGQRIILFRMCFLDDTEYCNDIVDYLNGRDDITYDQMVFILEELGFAVFDDGTVKW